MESKKIESIFKDYINKEHTNYALLISGKWGSGKTFLWKNLLKKKAVKEGFRPVYISLNGIESIKEVENIVFSSLLPISKTLEKKGVKEVVKILRNTANIAGKIFARGTQLIDITKGIKINVDVSKTVLCFDDLERCKVEPESVLGLINEYTEHKNAKVIIFSAEEEIDDKSDYNRVKEKVVGRILTYTANYDELFDSYVSGVTNSDFKKFLSSNSTSIIHFFKNHNIQNLRTFSFYLENLKELYEYFKDENETEVDRMLFFTAIISNEFKIGNLTVVNLEDKKGIDDFMLFINLDDVVDGMLGTPIVKSNTKEEVKEKSYSEKFIDKYLSNQNEKERYVFSSAIYEYVLTGFFDDEKLKNEISTRTGKSNGTKEESAYNTLMGYNFRVLENDELDKAISDVLDYAEKGKYKMYSYQTIFNNLSFHIKIGSLGVTEEDLVSKLLKGLDISKTISEVNPSEISHILHFKKEENLNDIEKRILELHNEKRDNEKNEKANRIFMVIEQELVEVDNFFNEILNSENCLFEFINPDDFFEKMIGLKNKNLLVFSNALDDRYKKSYIEFPEKERPFFETLKGLINDYFGHNDLKNPKKVILEELMIRIDEVIKRLTKVN